MIYDALLELSDSQGAITASAATTNLLNMGASTVVAGNDATPAGFLVVDIEVTGTGTGTVAFAIQDCDTVGGTYVTIATNAAAVSTTLVAGTKIEIPLPMKHRQFIRGYVTVTGTVGALIFSAHINTN
jgi:hypothetical protein